MAEPPLVRAARSGELEEVGRLVAGGADVEEKDGRSMTALHFAAKGGHQGILRVLLDAGADASASFEATWEDVEGDPGANAATMDPDRLLALHVAAMRGDEGAVRVLLDAGADVAVRGRWGHTPLHHAARLGHRVTARALLDAGADASSNAGGVTPLHAAALEGFWGVAGDPLHYGASRGHEGTVRLLLSAGADVAAIEHFGMTPLHKACGRIGTEGTVVALLDAGADVGARDKVARTPLFYAALKGRSDVVGVLLHAGADLEATNTRGALMLWCFVINPLRGSRYPKLLWCDTR